MAKRPRVGIIALCDNVYKDEETNKIIIAGLYSGDIFISGFPAELRLSCYAELFIDDEEIHEADFQFFVGGKRRGGALVQFSVADPRSPASILIPPFGLPIEQPSQIELRLSLDESGAVKVLSKSVNLRETGPTVSPQPPARSPRGARTKASKP
jgi:hypothetical protein